jgi:hypothetical protein
MCKENIILLKILETQVERIIHEEGERARERERER